MTVMKTEMTATPSPMNQPIMDHSVGGRDRISRSSARDLMDSMHENRIKVRGDDALSELHARRDSRVREKKQQKSARRSSIMKSLAVLDIGDDDDLFKRGEPDYNSEGESSCSSDSSARRRYLRRGSVTKHKLEAEVGGMQPNSISVRLSDPGDYGSADYGSDYDYDSESERKRRYLRRGSVTKYSLDAHVGEMQPTGVMDDARNRPRKVLPPPPKPNSNRTLDVEKTSAPSKSSSRGSHPPLSPMQETGDSSHAVKGSKPKRSTSSKISKNLDDSGHRRSSKEDSRHRRVSANLDDSGHRRTSANLDDSGHRRLLRKSNLDDSGHRRVGKKGSSGDDERRGPKRDPSIASISSSCDDSDDEFAAVPASSAKKPPPRGSNGTFGMKNFGMSTMLRTSRQKPAPEPISPSPAASRVKGILKCGDGKRSAEKKNVRFGDLVITEFPIILGDNPAVTMGAPVTIDWTPQGEISYKLNVYESIRGARRRRRKLLISVSNRAILLLAAGYTIDDIADASINAQQIKFGRQESMQNQAWDRVNMMMETTGDAMGAIGNIMEDTGKKIRAIVKPLRNSETARTA